MKVPKRTLKYDQQCPQQHGAGLRFSLADILPDVDGGEKARKIGGNVRFDLLPRTCP
ncbi:MAG: hypothetical protein OXC63_15705 [Aestuariivita sp.]|nr:hypothetical protein [Aestuariivita sp.]MCY4346043.1 hypothetical protein [Aestuariivita sp.]